MKKGAVVIALTAALLSCAACAKQEPKETEKVPSSGTTQETEAVQEGGTKTQKSEEAVLSVWVAPALVSEEEQKMKQEDWYVSRVAKKFEEENPGVRVEFTVIPDQSAAHQTFKAAASTDSGLGNCNGWL